MSVKINKIQKHSLAESLSIKKNHTIISIDEQPVKDILDIMYLSQKHYFQLQYKDEKDQIHTVQVKNSFDKPLGFEVLLDECEQCINQCLFCFVDQMPEGLRKSLYIKDDDFLYSFFYGNFITLTNLCKKSIKKIIKQRISPLYVSVHTTDTATHKKMLGYAFDFNILETLKIFEKSEIILHTQIVLVPDVNNKEILNKSLTDLLGLKNIASIGIVPVGLTKYRKNLAALRKLNKNEAIEAISAVDSIVKKTESSLKENPDMIEPDTLVYFSDEMFILAELPIPAASYYGDFEQIENGIGMIRKSIENWKYLKKRFIKYLNNIKGNPVFVTSESGYHLISKIEKNINKNLKDHRIRVVIVQNHFWGDEVTVTGLLTWQDIKNQIGLADDEYPVFSSAIFNNEQRTLDDIPLSDIKKEINKRILVIDELFTDWEEY